MSIQEKAWAEYWKEFQENYSSTAKLISDSSALFQAFRMTFLSAFLQGNRL